MDSKDISQSGVSGGTQPKLADSYLHWYKNHPATITSHVITPGRIYTEEAENEFTPEVSDTRFKYHLCIMDPFARCYRSLKKIRAYRLKIQSIYEDIFCYLRWTDLPGGQHLIAANKNYLQHYIWLITYITSDIDSTNKDAARHLRYRFEDLLVQAENLGIVLQDLIEPMDIIVQSQALVDEVTGLVESSRKKRTTWLDSEKKILRLSVKPDSTMFNEMGDKFPDFSKLMIYARKECQAWTKFHTISESEKVDLVTKGLMEISEDLKVLKRKIKRPFRALKAADRHWCSSPRFRETLIPHMRQLTKTIKKIIQNGHIDTDDDHDKSLLNAFVLEASGHYEYILKYGGSLVEEFGDVILMIRLCYSFIREFIRNSVTVTSYEALIVSKFNAKRRRNLLKSGNFQPQDFYKVECPETLRKLPIVVAALNAEVCLHLQGHRNSYRSKASSAAPLHKFSMKLRSASVDMSGGDGGAEPSYGENRKALQFVSATD